MDERIVAACLRRGWISPSVEPKVRDLLRRGLHAEQALLGTGLVSTDRYGEALSEISGMPFMQADTPAFADDLLPLEACRRYGVCVLGREDRELYVGFSAPPDAATLKAVNSLALGHGLRLRPFSILHSDWRRLVRPVDAEAGALRRLRAILELAETGDAPCVRIVPAGEQGGIFFDNDAATPSLSLPAALLPSLRLAAKRIAESRDWLAEDRPQAEGLGVVLRRRVPVSEDPSDAEGLTIVIDPRARPVTEQEREEALHAALAGQSVKTLCRDASPWWTPAAEAGVPVRVIRL